MERAAAMLNKPTVIKPNIREWPLYAFAKNVFLGNIPTAVALFLIPVSYALGYLQYWYVEQRFQFVWRGNNSRYLRYLIAASLAVLFPVLFYLSGATISASKIDFAFRNRGLDFVCSSLLSLNLAVR